MRTDTSDTKELFQQRRAAYWKDILPHLFYVMRSGLAGFLILFFIVFSIVYARWLAGLPADFDARWIMAMILIPFIGNGAMRTFLAPADLVFLLPAEHRMGRYFRSAFVYSVAIQSVFLLISLLIIWPLHYFTPIKDNTPFIMFIVFIMALKAGNNYFCWRESQFVHAYTSRISLAMHWLAAGVLVWLSLSFPLIKIVPLSIFVMLANAVILRLPSQHKVHWMKLLEMEKKRYAQIYRQMNWFVNVPIQRQRYSGRSWTRFMSNRLGFNQQNTYAYLYLKTFLRTDLYGIVLRQTLLGVAIILLTPNGWLKGGVFVLFAYVTLVQLSELERRHRHLFWVKIYPLSEEFRIQSLSKMIAQIHRFVILVLFLPLLIPITMWWMKGILLGSVFVFSQRYIRTGLIKKWKEEG